MALIDRYIFRLAGYAFLVILGALSAVIWITQALKDFNMLTSEGQSILMFVRLVALLLPAMIALIAPVALFIAVIQTIQRLNGDSELVVLSASGISHYRLLRPILLLTTLVAIGIGAITIQIAPASYRSWRDLITSARAEFVSQIVREGRFNIIDNGIVFHYRERVGDALLGLFIQDRRDADLTIVYVAERGQIIESAAGSFLVLLDGSIQRETSQERDASIIGFKRYALDLAMLTPNVGEVTYRPRERSTLELMREIIEQRAPKTVRGSYISELAERFTTPLYSFMFSMIALAVFSRPRTTRQAKFVPFVIVIVWGMTTRIFGFLVNFYIQKNPNIAWISPVFPVSMAMIAGLAMMLPPLRPRSRKVKTMTA
jgi:lipopolysaccharide export system permease protein